MNLSENKLLGVSTEVNHNWYNTRPPSKVLQEVFENAAVRKSGRKIFFHRIVLKIGYMGKGGMLSSNLRPDLKSDFRFQNGGRFTTPAPR